MGLINEILKDNHILSTIENNNLALEAKDSKEAMERFVGSNILVAIKIIKQLNMSVTEDSIQAAIVGLILAVRNFDSSKGNITTYLRYWVINELMDLMNHVLYDDMKITNYSLKIAPVNNIDNLEDSFELHPGFLLILSGAHVQVRVSGSDIFFEKIPTQAIGDLEDALSMHLELNEEIVFTEISKLPDFYNIGMKYTVEVVEDAAYDKTYIVNIREIEETKEKKKESV